jgi:hypothetical protein
MIKKILAWITGKSDTAVAEAAPYKVDAPVLADTLPLGTEAVMATTEQRYVGENEQGSVYETVVVVPEAIVPAAAIETAPVTVKAKYKKSELNNMNKTELMALIEKHSIEVKTRSTKEELIKVLVKV